MLTSPFPLTHESQYHFSHPLTHLRCDWSRPRWPCYREPASCLVQYTALLFASCSTKNEGNVSAVRWSEKADMRNSPNMLITLIEAG